MTAEHLSTLKTFYTALKSADAPALYGLLDPSFVGIVSDGMPGGAGGRYEGPEAMLAMWGGVARHFAVYPEPEEFIDAGEGRFVVTGHYIGSARATGQDVKAAFAHMINANDGKLTFLRQITDTQRWVEALQQKQGTDSA
jgi:ketosteroid isomerase-like protein